ncbi:hypothetical protein [Alkanindiges illinoisensis]|uniref:hypothetical protein n=1 Tax=Alkanindiges illinoisensis TaxID=197183 RepID=UPI000478C094|nr:hypothetical protein [Alkanindiges illinoisensis]
MICNLTIFVIFIIAILLLNIWSKFIPPSAPSPQSDCCTVSDEVLRNYVLKSSVLKTKSIDQLIQDIGPFQNMGDFDFGRAVYAWHGQTLQIQVWTKSNSVEEIIIKEIT